ncbi:hypothetical protein [Chondromyces crocatus]|uniref:Uncharacterized protein n=1 Tax=Chondromyces crocatus TaxID=52 RepID=A0A0K1EDL1_CHOCO|nr:hypothetical protein [Chondromyces crocatus]AKT38965.1 uncharacterized protein CMC5_031120 [Chondromyces crocatus]
MNRFENPRSERLLAEGTKRAFVSAPDTKAGAAIAPVVTEAL